MKSSFLLVAATLGCIVSAEAAAPSLKVYRDDESTADTVYTAKQYVIGVTEPGATATIAGQPVHVYRTGSFGAEVNLKPGANTIALTATKDGRTTKATSKYVYVTERPARPAAKAVEDSVFASPKTVTTLPGAYLQYGNGGDRLGGSKMGQLEEGIDLTAIASHGRLYQVQLASGRTAFIPKEYVKDSSASPAPVNTGSASIFNIGKADRISISLPRRLAYTSRAAIDPSTLYVTLYGAMNNTNWLTQRNALGIIDFVDLIQEGSEELTFAIRLKDSYMWGYSISYEGNSLVIDVRHRPESLALRDLTIGLDAGHGGKYPGAWSPSGLSEKEVNLDIILKAADMLRAKGAKVVLTRDGDTGPSMTERKETWKAGNVDLAISVHNNASGNPLTPMGTSAYYKHIQNRALAASMHDAMLSLGVADFGLTGNFNFSLNAPTEYPNALVEVLFMSSLPEEELLADPDYRTRLAEKIVEGIENYLKEVQKQ
ncbi:MAG: N-acetylmuramoyl-L-alanine amidase [Muribaculaceae bacterium]|nr:N-acetylmuramoyl-L-alanine amidase [Muribaculaceae bacterium]